MSGGKVSGRELRAAFAKATTWGTPASVTRQILIGSSLCMESMPHIVVD